MTKISDRKQKAKSIYIMYIDYIRTSIFLDTIYVLEVQAKEVNRVGTCTSCRFLIIQEARMSTSYFFIVRIYLYSFLEKATFCYLHKS